jgi:hypothetical protein
MLEFAYFEYAFFHIVVRALNLENGLDIISQPSIQVVICLIVEVCLANEKKSSGILLLIVSKNCDVNQCGIILMVSISNRTNLKVSVISKRRLVSSISVFSSSVSIIFYH